MTKEQYFEMCDMLGTEPDESEMPIEQEDFPYELQQAFQIYYLLRDVWEGSRYREANTRNLAKFDSAFV